MWAGLSSGKEKREPLPAGSRCGGQFVRVHTELNGEPGTVRLRNNFFKKRKKGILEGSQRASLMSTGYSRADVLFRERVTEEGGGPASPSLSVPVCKMHARGAGWGGGAVSEERGGDARRGQARC